MTNIESERVIINRNNKDLYNFLSDFTNFSNLMPEQITNWQATPDTCSFVIQGMANIEMRISERIPCNLIKMKSDGKTPFEFTMQCNLDDNGENSTNAGISFVADLPPMIKMMAAKPLKNFVDLLVNKLKEVAEKSDVIK